MSGDLALHDFAAFFEEVHGVAPFPWQRRLLERLAGGGTWPRVLDLPTGSGKTAALDIALFHLALEANRGEQRRAAVRIVLVVDRRLVVDDAFARARKLADALERAPAGTVRARVADRLRWLAIDGPPLVARRLRGGLPREEDWARTPSQPTILCTTVDQVGSRLLFRGYGISDRMKPVHAGLLGSDCLILLDEAHLAEPFRQTLGWIECYRGEAWRTEPLATPWAAVLLTATPGTRPADCFGLDDADRRHPVLAARLDAPKPARLVEIGRKRSVAEAAADRQAEGELGERVRAILDEVQTGLQTLRQRGLATPALAIVVNRIARARACFAAIERHGWGEPVDALLLIGPQRAIDRDRIVERLAPVRTGADRSLERPLVIVSTQGIEAGVDLDLDGLVTELAPLDSLRQRFGRLNRAGRPITPFATVLAHPAELAKRDEDPVYGRSLAAAWQELERAAHKSGRDRVIEMGIRDCALDLPAEALAPKADAPVLLPAHLDLLSRTAPVPAQAPPVALYLHGPSLEPDAVNLVWRADLDPEVMIDDEAAIRLLELLPPRSGEAIALPVWAVRDWLEGRTGRLPRLADAPGRPDERESGEPEPEQRRVFRWRGRDGGSGWIEPRSIAPGDTVVVPARVGGLDAWGWNPEAQEPVVDVAAEAAEPFIGRRFVVRVAPGLLGEAVSPERLADTLSGLEGISWRDLRDALSGLPLLDRLRQDLARLDRARRGRVLVDLDLYGRDEDQRPGGALFVAPLGLDGSPPALDAASEDDLEGSTGGVAVELAAHCRHVAERAAIFAERGGLPCRLKEDLRLAGLLHDLGKADPRFQAWLHEDDPLGTDPDETALLAKSGRRPTRPAAATGLPSQWRHEALSVRLALAAGRLADAHDPALVLWLIGTHHGHGRPFFPHADPLDAMPRRVPAPCGASVELPPGRGPQSLAFDWQGRDWPSLFAELCRRYGPWELARLEAVLRLADHRASEAELFGEGR